MIGQTLSHYRILEKLGGSVVLLLAVLVSAPALLGAAPGINVPRPVQAIPRVERPPTLEDFLDMKPNGEMEGTLAKVEGFIQREPSDGAPSSQRAEAYLGYDDKNLYVIFVAFDSEPAKIRARMVPREDFRGDDFVQVLLDTFHDERRAYSFMANPFGIQRDALFTEGGGRRGGRGRGRGGGGCRGSFDFSFDTLWYSKGKLTDQGYLVWMAIPFKSLRFPSNRQQSWGILLYRNIPRVNEEAFWPHCSSRIEGRLNQAAALRGLENISPGRNIQLIPFGVFRSFRALDTRDDLAPQFVRDRADADVGLDAKFVFKDSLVVDVAMNPDFSQVESDEPQVTVNQRFEVFFPEKRPFFLENASFFETPINLLFTRRIADPQFGVRLTGKLGPYALGAFVIDDESPGKRVPANDPLHGKRARFSIFRVNRDLGAQSTLGFIFTDREFENGFNRVSGIDGRFKLSENWVLSFQGVTSATRDPEEDNVRLAGPAYNVELSRSGRQLFYKLEYNDRSPGFRTQPGFLRRADIRRYQQFVRYRFRPEGKYLVSWGPEFNTEAVFDHEGTRLDLTQDSEISWEFVGRTFLGFFYNWDRERLRPVDFDVLLQNRDFSRHRKGFSFNTSYIPQVTAGVNYSWGTRINFVPPDDQEPVLANLTSSNLEFTLRPITQLRIDNTYLLTRLTDRARGASILNNHIIRSKWNWQFNRELSLRVILQYNSVLANPEFTALDTTKNFNADFLIIYLINPGTALYVGYNGNAQNLSPDLFLCEGPGITLAGCPELPAGSSALFRPRNRFINDSKQFFVKLSYLFRF
ncbi:MAG: DUF5916 domain-containing protein [Terriglobia bacterium]